MPGAFRWRSVRRACVDGSGCVLAEPGRWQNLPHGAVAPHVATSPLRRISPRPNPEVQDVVPARRAVRDVRHCGPALSRTRRVAAKRGSVAVPGATDYKLARSPKEVFSSVLALRHERRSAPLERAVAHGGQPSNTLRAAHDHRCVCERGVVPEGHPGPGDQPGVSEPAACSSGPRGSCDGAPVARSIERRLVAVRVVATASIIRTWARLGRGSPRVWARATNRSAIPASTDWLTRQ